MKTLGIIILSFIFTFSLSAAPDYMKEVLPQTDFQFPAETGYHMEYPSREEIIIAGFPYQSELGYNLEEPFRDLSHLSPEQGIHIIPYRTDSWVTS